MATFGKKGEIATQPGGKPAAGAHPAPAVSRMTRPPFEIGAVMSRGEEKREPSPVFVHVEQHWPKYFGIGIAGFAVFHYAVTSGKTDRFSIVLAATVAGLFFYWIANRFRTSLNDLHLMRTASFKSPVYLAGVVAGLAYFVHSTFIASSEVMGMEVGEQTAFRDGFQLADSGAVALLLLKAAGCAVAGGIAFQFIAKRIFRVGNSTQVGG